jgi:hypothetical protein
LSFPGSFSLAGLITVCGRRLQDTAEGEEAAEETGDAEEPAAEGEEAAEEEEL